MLQTPSRPVKALLDLAVFFDTLDPAKYDQRDFDRCICGWQNHLAGRRTHSDVKAAARDLGLTQQQAERLFHAEAGRREVGSWLFGDYIEHPSPKDAASCLRHIAVTGELPASW